MHEIINKLIHQVDEESLECLCWLFNTIGKTLEQATNAKLSAPANDEAKKTVSLLFILSSSAITEKLICKTNYQNIVALTNSIFITLIFLN